MHYSKGRNWSKNESRSSSQDMKLVFIRVQYKVLKNKHGF